MADRYTGFGRPEPARTLVPLLLADPVVAEEPTR